MIKSFNEYNNDFSEILKLDENKSMVKYNFTEFKQFFNNLLLESTDSIDDKIYENAHTFYEFAMLAEAKPHWFDSPGELLRLDSGDHVILIKNNEAFILTSKTMNSINEKLSWDDLKSGWNYVKGVVSKGAQKILDTVSEGARKAWEFSKKCVNVAKSFILDSDVRQNAALVLSILGALLAVANQTIPGISIVAGICCALGGALNIWEAHDNYVAAQKVLSQVNNPSLLTATLIKKCVPLVTLTGILLAIGFYEVCIEAPKVLIDPTAGIVGLWIRNKAIRASNTFSTTLLGKSSLWLDGYIRQAMSRMGVQSDKVIKAGVSFTNVAIASMIAPFVKVVIGEYWNIICKVANKFVSSIQWILSIPKKLSEAFDKIKSSSNVIAKIISPGIELIAQPMVDFLAKLINTHISPSVNKAKEILERQIKANEECDKIWEDFVEKNPTIISGVVPVSTKDEKRVKINTATIATQQDLKKIKQIKNLNPSLQTASYRFSETEHRQRNLKHIITFESFNSM